MNTALLARMSLLNVMKQGRKSLGTLLVIAVSVMAFCLLAGYMQANVSLIENAFMRWGARGHLILERPTSSLAHKVEGAGQDPIEADMQARLDDLLAADPAVVTRARILRISGMVANAEVSTIFAGIGQDVQQIRTIKGPAYEYDVVAGAPLWKETGGDGLVLGQGLAAILGCDVPDVGFAPVQPGQTPESRPLICPPGPLELTVSTRGTARVNVALSKPTGIMDWGIKEVNDRLVVMPLAAAQALLNTSEVSQYHVLLEPGADLDAAKGRLEEAMREAGLDITVFRWSDRAAFYQQVKAVLSGFLNFIAVVAAIVGFTSLLNSSYMSYMNRAREFATLRSVGFSRRFVIMLTAMESAWLAGGATTLGVAAAAAVTWLIQAAKIMWTPPGSSNAVPVEVAWVPLAYLVSFLLVVGLAALASFLPIRKILIRPIRAVLAEA